MKMIKRGYREAWPDPIPHLDLRVADDGTLIDGHHHVLAMHRRGVRLVAVDGVVYDISNIEEPA